MVTRSLHRSLVASAIALVIAPLYLSAQTPPRTGAAPTGSARPSGAPAAGASGAPGETEIQLGTLEQRLLPIAIPAMRGSSGATEVTDVLRNDLRISALMRVLEPNTFTANLDAEGLDIVPAPWVTTGATAVVKAQITGDGAGARAEVRVWEPGRPAAPVLSRTFGPASPRSLAHQIANELLRHYTGRAGVFGTRILFARGMGRNRKDVFTVDCDGANLGMVSPGRRLNITPTWGPGGIYYSAQTREGFLQLVRASRPTPTPVLAIDGMVMGATFGGGRLAVVLNRDGNSEIYSASPDGQNLRRLTTNNAADVSPVFSPNGSQIAFVSDRDGSPQIYVMGADGSGQRRVTTRGSYNQTPSWSPDGSTIAYASREGGSFDIYTVSVSGGAVRRLTEGQGSNTDPTFSPDGRLIAFNSSRGGIWIMNQDGLRQVQILAGGGESLRWER